jgi:putative ABC transport system ATP-binding protein
VSERPIVEARGLVKTYRKGAEVLRPVDGIDLDVMPGEFLALMGPSGSGKSTLLHLIGGLDRPDQGRIRVGDAEVSAMDERALCAFRAAHVGFVFQVYNLVPVLTARENIELPLRLLAVSKARRRRQVDSALAVVDIADRANHLPSELSGGEEQRVAIARALVTDPQIIIADEPTGDLDEQSGRQVVDILATLSAEYRKTVIMVTHNPDAAERADRILYLHRGRLLDRNPRELRAEEVAP